VTGWNTSLEALMNCAVLNPQGGYRLEKQPVPDIAPGEALIRVLACGLCSSDIGAWKKGLGRDEIMGHEVVGIVEKIEDRDSPIPLGTRVTGSILRGYAEYTKAKAENLLPVPQSLSDDQAIIEPYVCLQSGLDTIGMGNYPNVAVIGAGFMGLALVRLLKIAGVKRVTSLDLVPGALSIAKEMGADETVHPAEAEGRTFDVVFEAAGSQGSLDLCGHLVRQYGIIGIVGYHPCVRSIDMAQWAARAPTVVNVFEYRKERQREYMGKALLLSESGELPVGRLFTHSFPLSEIEKAFDIHVTKKDGYIKGYISDFTR
jgi:threonine dehydrogenase-like Zn-dependent dehydrogenase